MADTAEVAPVDMVFDHERPLRVIGRCSGFIASVTVTVCSPVMPAAKMSITVEPVRS